MSRLAELRTIIYSDRARMRVLDQVRALGLPDCWVAAGFVRNCVWDHLHGYTQSPLPQDIDVIWYDPADVTPARDADLEAALHSVDSTCVWSVKNQARMHGRNGDRPYHSAHDAMRHWPETATAVGVRLDRHGGVEVAAPYGLGDLFGLIIRPGARFLGDKHPIYLERMHAKQWQVIWPGLAAVSQA
jgi:hypothetical protein